jgi:hypothetical protein
MPIPKALDFKSATFTTKTKIGIIDLKGGYGGNIAPVLAALEDYWDHQQGADTAVKEMLLYNVWKQCSKWLKVKSKKIKESESGTPGSKCFERRKQAVKDLRSEVSAELESVSPQTKLLLDEYQSRKATDPLKLSLMGYEKKPLAPGYSLEREYYEKHSKEKGIGYTVSASHIRDTLEQKPSEEKEEKNKDMEKLKKKGFKGLTVKDVTKNFEMGKKESVAFMNKIARLKHLVVVTDHLLGDIDSTPILMREKGPSGYFMCPYAMDMYGNIFIYMDISDPEVIFRSDTKCKLVRVKNFNHSTFLAGRAVLCAGNMHIGYDVRNKKLEAGKLSCIDNGSGHYQPSKANLRNCLEVLEIEGVDIDAVRVADFSAGADKKVVYWGKDFQKDANPWVNDTTPRDNALTPPPVNLTGV